MPFGLQRLNEIERVEAHRAIGPAMDAQIALSIALQARRSHNGSVPRKLRYASIGDIYRMQGSTKVHEL